MAAAAPHIHVLDDRDLDDAELWAVIDSAAASRSSSRPRRPLLALQSGSPSVSPLPCASLVPAKLVSGSPGCRIRVDEVRGPADGEVVQEEQWSHRRPPKMARFVDHRSYAGDQVVCVRHPPQSPTVSSPSPSPEAGAFAVHGVSPVVEVKRLDFSQGDERENQQHSLSGRFPSVSLFKQYHNAAMSILEKGDYTVVSGNPFIKKSGWRKIALFFNISFEIKDKTIEFDESRNVVRAEFVVRAFMRGGRFSDGWGSCERREKRFCKPNHDVPSTAETRAKNKACQ
ncbi:hypothetical protein Taro_031380, partial [Colocasia esculenta]|nr:hypothetical protein [Colocasia esculenta]